MKPIPFQYTYSTLPDRFYQLLGKSDFTNPQLLKWNDSLALELGLHRQNWTDKELALIFSCRELMPNAKPLAQAYSGHQFGNFNPELGDGRARLLGEIKDAKGHLRDIHLKGSGQTRYSRSGDGRANLSAVVREYLLSEALYHLGVPSSRTLAIIGTGESVQREDIQPGAILVRVAASHIRVGTFEHFVSRGDFDAAKILANFVIDRHHPDLKKDYDGYLELFQRIVISQAELVAKWLNIGFIHGVMNTDNTFISGETLDFGPCAFLENYDSETVFSYIDRQGRYAYGKQPGIMQWNLACLAHCFLNFIPTNNTESLKNKLQMITESFESYFSNYYLKTLGLKFGFKKQLDSDAKLFHDYFQILQSEKWDYTLSFRKLSEQISSLQPDHYPPAQKESILPWLDQWRARLNEEGQSPNSIKSLMDSVNPAYIARNHRVEEAIKSALKNDYSKFDRLNEVLKSPYDEKVQWAEFLEPAAHWQQVTTTFCNT